MNKEKKENGVLSSQEIFSLINNNTIYSEQEIDKEIIQPASIDLRLGVKAWRVPASFLPGKGNNCLLYTSPSPRDRTRSRMPSSA